MSAYAGTPLLTRFAFRRDRILAGVWMLVLILMVYVSAAATPTLFKTQADQVSAAVGINASSASVALYGPILDVHSLGELAMTKTTVLYSVFLAALVIVLVRRHTRVEEESGRLELVGGTAVGSSAQIAAALSEAVVVSVVTGLLAALASAAGGLPVRGSFVFGATWIGIGLVAAGIGILTAQLSASARTCAGIAAGIVGVLYVIRAIGDTSAHWLSWLSPFGWNTQIRAWSDSPRWWVLALYVLLAAVLFLVGVALTRRRDLGSGMIAARPGPAVGSPRLADALALCWRLNSGVLLAWSLAMAALGAIFGAIAPGFNSMLDSDSARELFERLGGEGALANELIAAILSIVAIVITCFAVSITARTGSDESDGRAEAVLATATSRSRWYWASVIVGFGGALWLLLVIGVFLWIGYGAAGAPAGAHPARIVPAALTWAPAVWFVAALAVALLAVRRAALGWALPALCLVITMLGEAIQAPSWFIGISPFSHIPLMPTEDFALTPVLVLTVLAALVLIASWRWFRRRDIG